MTVPYSLLRTTFFVGYLDLPSDDVQLHVLYLDSHEQEVNLHFNPEPREGLESIDPPKRVPGNYPIINSIRYHHGGSTYKRP